MTSGAQPEGALELVALLQLVDSGFPSGAYTLSHGLESLVADGQVRDLDDLAAVVEVQLVSRLARADLPATVHVHDADPERLMAIDHALFATKLATEERTGTRRVGRRIADEAARLARHPGLDAFIAAVEHGHTPGTSAVAFGLAAAALGIPARMAATGAASAFVMGQTAAAVRMGLLGHRDAQQTIRRSAAVIDRAVAIAVASDPLDPRPSAPAIDIAMARHETASVRMFAS